MLEFVLWRGYAPKIMTSVADASDSISRLSCFQLHDFSAFQSQAFYAAGSECKTEGQIRDFAPPFLRSDLVISRGTFRNLPQGSVATTGDPIGGRILSLQMSMRPGTAIE
jgi:hypothetical protein